MFVFPSNHNNKNVANAKPAAPLCFLLFSF